MQETFITRMFLIVTQSKKSNGKHLNIYHHKRCVREGQLSTYCKWVNRPNHRSLLLKYIQKRKCNLKSNHCRLLVLWCSDCIILILFSGKEHFLQIQNYKNKMYSSCKKMYSFVCSYAQKWNFQQCYFYYCYYYYYYTRFIWCQPFVQHFTKLRGTVTI